jgi:hypothetical protein
MTALVFVARIAFNLQFRKIYIRKNLEPTNNLTLIIFNANFHIKVSFESLHEMDVRSTYNSAFNALWCSKF